jgi:hypothetical protein
VKGFGSDSFGGYTPSVYDKPLNTNNRKEVYDLDRFYDSENSSDDDNTRAKASGLYGLKFSIPIQIFHIVTL